MTPNACPKVDVLICVGSADVDRLMPYSVKSCLRYFEPLENLFIVTSVPSAVVQQLELHGLNKCGAPITVLGDQDVLPATMAEWPGWCKQQMIRLRADLVCNTDIVACLSADTVICRTVTKQDLFLNDQPILYFNRYGDTESHLEYERQRVVNIAALLQVEPHRSLPLGDFIMDLKLLEASYLRQLRAYLASRYGDDPWTAIVPQRCDTLAEKLLFGEWTLYSVFMLDVLKVDVPIRNSQNRFISQVHSAREFDAFHFDAHVVHFVDKSLELSRVYPWLDKWGLL